MSHVAILQIKGASISEENLTAKKPKPKPVGFVRPQTKHISRHPIPILDKPHGTGGEEAKGQQKHARGEVLGKLLSLVQ